MLKGTVIAQEGDVYTVRGTRTAGTFTPPVHTLSAQEIITNHVPERQRPKKTEFHGSGLSVQVAESIRRKELLTARLGMTEAEILQARVLLEIRKRTLRKLAASNGISYTLHDFEYAELQSEYLVATLAALRSATSSATDAEVDQFRDYIQGREHDSRIMLTIARTSKTAAIRYLDRRAQYRRQHVDINDYTRRMAA